MLRVPTHFRRDAVCFYIDGIELSENGEING